jgi:hypothetical protein
MYVDMAKLPKVDVEGIVTVTSPPPIEPSTQSDETTVQNKEETTQEQDQAPSHPCRLFLVKEDFSAEELLQQRDVELLIQSKRYLAQKFQATRCKIVISTVILN